MAKIDALQRLLIIINKLERNKGYILTDELREYVAENMRIRYSVAADYSLRTLQRDINDIKLLFGIIISNKKDYGYYIAEREEATADKYEKMLLDFDLLAALDAESGLHDYVLAEHHRPLGSRNMAMLMTAIRNNYPVELDYIFVRYDDKVVHKKVNPHFLKESNQRWYLLAMDEGVLKTFGADRIYGLQVLDEEYFERDTSINIENLFRDSYGIWDQADIPVEDIVLSYDTLDGKFLKTLPLHHSQQVLVDTDDEFRIAVRLRITNDFVMELLSRSRSLTVIEPLSLRKRIYEIYKNAKERNRI